MKQLELVIRNRTGLHARPARVFVDIAKQFQSSIRVGHKEKQVNAKSLISVLTLGVESGQRIFIDVEGADEAAAIAALEAAVWSGLGEELVALDEPRQQTADKRQETRDKRRETEEPSGLPVSGLIRGVPGAPGLAIGPIHQFRRAEIVVQDHAGGVVEEQARLSAALDEAREQLAALHEQVLLRAANAEAAIFEVHREILADPDLLDLVRAKIEAQRGAAEAWQAAIAERAAALAGLRDPLLAERAADVRDVGERVLRLLVGVDTPAPALPDEPFILVAYDLTPSETVALDPKRVLGFCTAVGGPNAHTAILARALGLPAIVSAGAQVLDLADRTEVILDGQAGTLAIGTASRSSRTLAASPTLAAPSTPAPRAWGCCALNSFFSSTATRPPKTNSSRSIARSCKRWMAGLLSFARSISAATSHCPTSICRPRRTRSWASAASGCAWRIPSYSGSNCARSCARPRMARCGSCSR